MGCFKFGRSFYLAGCDRKVFRTSTRARRPGYERSEVWGSQRAKHQSRVRPGSFRFSAGAGPAPRAGLPQVPLVRIPEPALSPGRPAGVRLRLGGPQKTLDSCLEDRDANSDSERCRASLDVRFSLDPSATIPSSGLTPLALIKSRSSGSNVALLHTSLENELQRAPR